MPRHVSYPAVVQEVLTRLFAEMAATATQQPAMSILSVTRADLDQLPAGVASAVRAEMTSAGYDPATVTEVKFAGGRVDEVTVTVAEPAPVIEPAPVDVVPIPTPVDVVPVEPATK